MGALLLAVAMAVASPDDVRTLARGTISGIDRPREAVVQTEAQWRVLWSEHAPGASLPRVDFTSRTVLAVFLGSRNSAGYGIEITGVTRTPENAVVHYREIKPGPDQMRAQILTAPFHVVHVSRLEGPVTFVKQHVD